MDTPNNMTLKRNSKKTLLLIPIAVILGIAGSWYIVTFLERFATQRSQGPTKLAVRIKDKSPARITHDQTPKLTEVLSSPVTPIQGQQIMPIAPAPQEQQIAPIVSAAQQPPITPIAPAAGEQQITPIAAAPADTNRQKATLSLPETTPEIIPRKKPKFTVSGVILAADGNVALINGAILKVGDELDGATILEINADNVTVDLQGEKITLKIK